MGDEDGNENKMTRAVTRVTKLSWRQLAGESTFYWAILFKIYFNFGSKCHIWQVKISFFFVFVPSSALKS